MRLPLLLSTCNTVVCICIVTLCHSAYGIDEPLDKPEDKPVDKPTDKAPLDKPADKAPLDIPADKAPKERTVKPLVIPTAKPSDSPEDRPPEPKSRKEAHSKPKVDLVKPETPKAPVKKTNVERDETGKEIDFGPYMQDLQRQIKRSWFPPTGNESKRVVVIFDLGRAGNLRSIRLSQSSGNKAVDNAGLVAVRKASPFRPLPLGAPEKVAIQFTFDYNVFRGSGGSISSNGHSGGSSGASLGNTHYELIKAGRAAFLAKKYDLALQKFNEADEYSSYTEKDIKLYKATIYDRQATQLLAKDPKAAATLYRKALLEAPNSHYVIKNLDQALDKQGIKSSSYKQRSELADKFMSEDKYDFAEFECSRALTLALAEERNLQADPSASNQSTSEDRKALETKRDKITSTIRGRREEERWRNYLQFINHTSFEAHLGLGLALERQGKFAEAKKAAEEALLASPKNEAVEQLLKRLQGLAEEVSKPAEVIKAGQDAAQAEQPAAKTEQSPAQAGSETQADKSAAQAEPATKAEKSAEKSPAQAAPGAEGSATPVTPMAK